MSARPGHFDADLFVAQAFVPVGTPSSLECRVDHFNLQQKHRRDRLFYFRIREPFTHSPVQNSERHELEIVSSRERIRTHPSVQHLTAATSPSKLSQHARSRLADWPNRLALPHRRKTRRRRHGRGLQSRRHAAAALRRAEISPAGRGSRPASPGPFPARSAGCLRAESSEHLHDLRHWRARRPSLHRHGISRRANAEAPHRRPPRGHRGLAQPRDRNCRRARRRARRRHRPSRHQAGKHLRHQARPRQDSGFRPREGHVHRRRRVGFARRGRSRRDARRHSGRRASHQSRLHHGHRRLHVARAGARQGARRPLRSFFIRRGAL